ncbi:MAG: hypothetical protein ACOVOX_13455 [Burkholderiaceae bacterium]
MSVLVSIVNCLAWSAGAINEKKLLKTTGCRQASEEIALQKSEETPLLAGGEVEHRDTYNV